jgi:hypothetical protein
MPRRVRIAAKERRPEPLVTAVAPTTPTDSDGFRSHRNDRVPRREDIAPRARLVGGLVRDTNVLDRHASARARASRRSVLIRRRLLEPIPYIGAKFGSATMTSQPLL